MLAATEIAAQPEPDTCAHAAVINLFRLRGLQPEPTFEGLKVAVRQARGLQRASGAATPTGEGVSIWEIHSIIANAGRIFASVCYCPPQLWDYPKAAMSPYLDAGCQLIVFFNLYAAERRIIADHVVVAEGYDDERGMIVLDSEPGWYEGTTIELQPRPFTMEQLEDAEKWLESNSHGSRRRLPFYRVQTPENIFGLSPYFIVVHPPETLTEMERARSEQITGAIKNAGAVRLQMGTGARVLTA